ncbi:MAG TPA: gliding motility-associated C-terminal domain-containing protein, partial [Saprospiraceae bacterium]|nr:gliding motility-associated C-terminal domain-containing protein [Saprospiraceae bacterium]
SIIINENPVADAGPDKLITCAEPSVSIGSNNSTTGAGISYNWSGNVTNAKSLTTQTAVPGIYQLTVTNTSTTCFSTDNVTVTLANDLPLPSNLEIDSINCFGQSDAKIKFDNIQGGTSPYTVFLNNVDFGSAQYFTKLPPGTYELKISDANGCTSTQTITITEPEKIYLELGSDVTVELGDSVHIEPFINIPLSNIDTIIWTPLINGPNGVCAGCFDHVLYPYYTTPLEMLVIDNKGCRVSDQMHITVDVVRQIFFPNIFSPNEDALNERFYPFADDRVVKIHEFRVFDRWGNMVFEQTNFLPNDYDKGWDGTRNGKHLNAGVYVYYAVVEFRDGAKKVFKGDVTLVH